MLFPLHNYAYRLYDGLFLLFPHFDFKVSVIFTLDFGIKIIEALTPMVTNTMETEV